MLTCRARFVVPVMFALLVPPAGRAVDPTDNPVAAFYAGPDGYPAWTDSIHWANVVNMKTYPKGKTDYEKFEKARDQVAEQGGVLYYPAGVYDFTTMPAGRGLFLRKGVVVRGETPPGRPVAADGKLDLPTKFVFGFRERGGGKVPRDWNVIGLMTENEKRQKLREVDQVGIAWVHLVGATVSFGPQMDWGKTWATANSLASDTVKKAWGARQPDGTHPFDPLAGGGKKYEGAGARRLVFGCVLEDAAVLDDFLDAGYGPNGFHTQRYCARVAVYGSRVLVANNLLPKSKKGFRYRQPTQAKTTDKAGSFVLFDYGKTVGIDVNKELFAHAGAPGPCPGYVEEGVVVRDNFVFNHGQKGYSVAGNWVTIAGNVNDRAYLRPDDNVYGLGPSGVVTLDGWEVPTPAADNLARAFDLAGRNLWVDGNRFTNTGATPGTGGEGIVCRGPGGTPIESWAITHNTHTRGVGSVGGMGGSDVDCRGLLVGWNQTPGWVGNLVNRGDTKLTDCAFVANKCDKVVPDEKTATKLGLRPPLTTAVPGGPAPPTKVTATAEREDAVRVTWAGGFEGAVGFRVERQIAGGKWKAIAYRPPQIQPDPANLPVWVDFTAPPGKDLVYRVVALDTDDSDKGASEPTAAVLLSGGGR